MILGIDYGSKMAGTTVIAFMKTHNEVELIQSKKNEDADQMILDFVTAHQDIWLIFLDAPLSLPEAYSNSAADDFFYRAVDRELSAMSPMFLGGLTARAMKLKNELQKLGVQVVETYPKALSQAINLDQNAYKKDQHYLEEVSTTIERLGHWTTLTPPQNWHQIDALLCLLSAKRHEIGRSKVYGKKSEGQIII